MIACPQADHYGSESALGNSKSHENPFAETTVRPSNDMDHSSFE